MTTLADRIQLGVLYLDDTQPGWQDKIDILKLDINSYSSCVLGQVRGRNTDFEDYREETWKLHDWLEVQGIEVDGNAAEAAGFDSTDFDQEGLTRAWVEVLGR